MLARFLGLPIPISGEIARATTWVWTLSIQDQQLFYSEAVDERQRGGRRNPLSMGAIRLLGSTSACLGPRCEVGDGMNPITGRVLDVRGTCNTYEEAFRNADALQEAKQPEFRAAC